MEASGDMTRWLSRPKWRLWFRQIIAPPSNVQCGVKRPNGSDRRRPIYLPFQLEDLKNLEFCKSVRLRSQESFGRQSSLRTTDSNQVLGIGAQDCGIYASAVCVHIKNGAPELRGSHTEGCLLVRCGFPDFVTVQKRTTYRRPLNALYTPTSAMEFRHGNAFPSKNIVFDSNKIRKKLV